MHVNAVIGSDSNFISLYIHCRACEELVRTLGFDWLLMFMEEHLHSTTVTAALWILVVLLSNQSILNRFKEGLCGGGWLDHTDSVLTNKIGTVLGKWKNLGWAKLTKCSHYELYKFTIKFHFVKFS